MSGLQARVEDTINGVDVREQGSALRVATNTPHLVSLGTGRLSTAVTLHPIKQGRVTIGSEPTCDIYVVGSGVAPVHCRVENSYSVLTLYPINGVTLLDGVPVDKPTRLCQGSMLTIGRSNYLRFNHPQEAKLMKSVLPSGHMSMAPIQFTPDDGCGTDGQANHTESTNQCYQNTQKMYRENTLSQLDQELDLALKEMSQRKKPPVAPRKPFRDIEQSDSDQETKPKMSSIMAKVSKFEYYAKQQKSTARSQFYTNNDNEISPKVFSANSLTVNTPAKDVLGGKAVPNFINKIKDQKVVVTENNSIDPKHCSYANVAIRNKTKIDDIVRNFDDNPRLPKKVNNEQHSKDNNIYGKINKDRTDFQSSEVRNAAEQNLDLSEGYGRVENVKKLSAPSPAYDRNPNYAQVYTNCTYDKNLDAEQRRIRAYQDRVKEEEQKEAETARLEEILNMCAEYERQISSGTPITPTEKRAHNKIITNGSLPRSTPINNPNFVQTSDGYYKFDTSHNRTNSLSQSLPIQRNLSSYENFDVSLSPSNTTTPEVTINANYENVGRMDEIGIPVFDSPRHDLSSPIMIRKLQNGDHRVISTSPVGSPYENVLYNRSNLSLKPKSPNTQSPRSRIKTTFAHKNLPSPQYFIFPTPPPVDSSKKPNFNQIPAFNPKSQESPKVTNTETVKVEIQNNMDEKTGIEKQLSLEEEIPMIDDTDLSDDIEFRSTKTEHGSKPNSPNEVLKIKTAKGNNNASNSCKEESDGSKPNSPAEVLKTNISAKGNVPTSPKYLKLEQIDKLAEENKRNSFKDYLLETESFIQKEQTNEKLNKNKSFDDVKKELMADIPELEEFERDLKENRRDKVIKNVTEDLRNMHLGADSIDSIADDNVVELKGKYEKLKNERKKLVADIHEIKCKMTEIRSQEDDILRELEMEKALIKGEYDSEIAILNIEQKKKADLLDKAKSIEEDIKKMKEKQESRQNDLRDRVEIATLKVERIEKDLKTRGATMEELQNAQDILDNETKIFEDLEFQHLEEESELLANREDIQNEIIALSKKIESQKSRILTLKSEANDNLTSALDETKILQAEYVRLLNHVEKLTSKVQTVENELKPIVSKLNEIERTQSPDSAFYTDQTRTKSGEFGYSPQSSDSDDLDITKVSNFENHTKELKDKFNSIDRMSQSMIVDIERRVINDITEVVDENVNRTNESPSKSSTSSREKKGFWERNFDSLKRKKKPKSPEKTDIMSQSLNENMFYNNETIENDSNFDKFNSLRHSKKKDKPTGPIKSSSSSKIPTFAGLGKLMKKDSFGKKKDVKNNDNVVNNDTNNRRYVKNAKPSTDNKYKSKSLSPEKFMREDNVITEENEDLNCDTPNNIYDNYNRTEHSNDSRKSSKDSTENPRKDSIEKTKEHPQESQEILNSNSRKNSKENAFENRKASFEKDAPKILHRKSCGDEPGIKNELSELKKISDSGKIPSQDDIDRISKVTMDAPLFSSDTDMNSLGKRTLDSLMEIERKRMEMLEEQGCQVIENEREKISELKRRAQDETKKLWDQKYREQSKSLDSDCQVTLDSLTEKNDRTERTDESSLVDDSFNMTSSGIFDESSGLMSSIEELQVRNSRGESTEDDKRSDDSRPLSHASDFSGNNMLWGQNAPRRNRTVHTESRRPLTRYLPVDRDDFDLRRHIESAGHQIELCPYLTITSSSCRGYLHKLGAKFHTWSKRWFVFDRETKTFVYYWDKSEKKPRGGAYFQVIEEVYLDHGNTSKSPSPQTTFIVKTRQRKYYLMAPSGESARIWIDVIFTGAQGYTEYLE